MKLSKPLKLKTLLLLLLLNTIPYVHASTAWFGEHAYFIEAPLLGGGRTKVDIIPNEVLKEEIVGITFAENDLSHEYYMARKNLRDGATFEEWRGEHAAELTYEEEISLDDGFKIKPCISKYNTRNGIDSLYVVLDEEGDIAKFNADGILMPGSSKARSKVAIFVNESKYSATGRLDLREGFRGYAPPQCSHEWIVYVEKKVERERAKRGGVPLCPVVSGPASRLCEHSICERIHAILTTRPEDVIRTANVLNDERVNSIYALGDTRSELALTSRILRNLFIIK
jgi:hypothetical protein